MSVKKEAADSQGKEMAKVLKLPVCLISAKISALCKYPHSRKMQACTHTHRHTHPLPGPVHCVSSVLSTLKNDSTHMVAKVLGEPAIEMYDH